MNDVGGSDSGTGLRAAKSSRSSDANFEYDDSEWDVGIGNLIIDLDADIEKNNEANRNSSSASATNNNSSNNTSASVPNAANSTSNSNSNSPGNSNSSSSLTPGSSATSAAPQMHIPHSSATSSGASSNNTSSNINSSPGGKGKSSSASLSSSAGKHSSSNSTLNTPADLSSSMEHSAVAVVDKGLKMKIKRKAGTKSGVDAKHEIVKSDLGASVSASISTSNPSSVSNTNAGSSNKGGSTEIILSKSAHTSSSHKDKVKDNSMIMIDSERDSGSVSSASINHSASGNSSSSISTTNNGNSTKDAVSGSGNDQGSKGKTPRKGSNHKKVKSASGSSKKDEKNTSSASSSASETKGNSSSGVSGTSHSNKDGKEFFSTTVSLNVPTIVPSASSSFGKTTLKVPTATSSIPPSSQNTMQMHSSSSADPSSRTHTHLSSATAPSWSVGSPSKSGDSKIVGSLSTEKSQIISSSSNFSYVKKPRSFGPTEKGGMSQEDGMPGTSGQFTPTVNSSYRSASISDLSNCSGGGGSNSGISSPVNLQGMPDSLSSSLLSSSKSGRAPGSTQDVCVGTSVGTVTEPDCLGPCEPGTSVTLEGIVWHETESGVLVVNVTWRGKTYVGTLLDCTKSEWAPPRFCDSPTSDLEMRMPKNRGKRGRGQAATPVNEVQSEQRPGNTKLRNGAKGRRGSASNTVASAFVAPASPLKGEQWPKRKTRGSENESQDEPVATKNSKRPKLSKEERKERQSKSPAPDADKSGPSSPALIECPEPNCSKKYKHINGLRYHQSHAHCNNFAAEDSDSNASTTSTQLTSTIDSVANVERSESETMALDDLDVMEASSGNTDDSINGNINSAKSDEKVFDLQGDSRDSNEKSSSDSMEPTAIPSVGKSSLVSLKNGKNQKETLPGDKESDAKLSGDSTNNSKESSNLLTLASRAPILTVPVPYISLQNRTMVHGHTINVPRGDSSLASRDQDNVMKPSPIPAVGGGTILSPKGVSWQPHSTQPNPGQPGSIQLPQNMVPLNIPLSSDRKDKEKNVSLDGQGKKSKHKKKSKDKDGKSKDSKGDGSSRGHSSSGSSGGIDVGRSTSSVFASSISGLTDSKEGRTSDSADELRLGKDPNKSDGSNGSGNLGDGRDDPQSPAYSDISDANDSGDTDLNVSVKEGVKNLVMTPDILKKDVPPGAPGHPMSPFYPTFYSPYIDSNHASKLGDKTVSSDDLEKSKVTAKPIPQTVAQGPSPISGQSIPPPGLPNPDDPGRSPKMDFHHPKYLPQQHFFHYPYSNYHFDQGQYNNMMPENAFNPSRAFSSVEEQGKEREMMMGDHEKGKLSEKDVPLGMSIKQEPVEKLSKDSRPQNINKPLGDEKQMEIKSEFGSDYPHSKSVPHFMGATCSKHSKEHSKRDSDSSKIDRSGLQCDKHKEIGGSGADLDKEIKEREKNEGVKPTMETQGPPPPPTAGSFAYLPQPYLQGNPFGLHFDPGHPLYRQVIVPGPFGGPPYMHPHPGSIPRFQPPPGATPLPEDLSRPSNSGPGPPPKALDMLQHHAQYYQVHKIHELSERALKSPNSQVGQRDRDAPTAPVTSNIPSPGGLNIPNPGGPNSRVGSGNIGVSGSGSVPKPADLSKDSKIGSGSQLNESSRSPPTQHHVHSHTHHHTHVGIGYPIIPAFPAPHSPHYGVIPTPPTAASVIPPFSSQKPN